MRSQPMDDTFLDAPEDAPRWVRLMERCREGRPEVFQTLIEGGEPPRLTALLRAMDDDAEAMAEDLALQAWTAWEADKLEEARALWERARTRNPEDAECRVLGMVLDLEGEACLQALQEESKRQREALPESALLDLDEGRGAEHTDVLRLHRCLAEQVQLLVDLERWEECVALVDEMFLETGEDTFGVFPALVQAALHTEDLEVLDTWVNELGADYPGLQEWLQTYLAQTADQLGAAFQALRRARKVLPQLELPLIRWHNDILKAGGGELDSVPAPTFPIDKRASAAFLVLAPAFISTPDFMAWLKKMRTLR